MSFTQEEIEIMDKEVEEDMDDQEMDAPVFDTEDLDSAEECDNKIRNRGSDSEDSTHCERTYYIYYFTGLKYLLNNSYRLYIRKLNKLIV